MIRASGWPSARWPDWGCSTSTPRRCSSSSLVAGLLLTSQRKLLWSRWFLLGRAARLPDLPAESDLDDPARLPLLRVTGQYPRQRAQRGPQSAGIPARRGALHAPDWRCHCGWAGWPTSSSTRWVSVIACWAGPSSSSWRCCSHRWPHVLPGPGDPDAVRRRRGPLCGLDATRLTTVAHSRLSGAVDRRRRDHGAPRSAGAGSRKTT